MKSQNKIASFFYALFINFRHFKFIQRIERVVEKMNSVEKVFFYFLSLVFALSSLMLLAEVHNSFLVEVPSFGGNFSEGLIGSPRFVNPILAISDTDKDLTSIIYSGLLKSGDKGVFLPDLAESYEIKEAGRVYDFFIKDDAYFHDGKKVTADDIVFTIEKALDPVIKSPKKSNWEGVVVEKVSDREIRFTLNKPYVAFLETLTLGILPKHIWENATSEEFPFSEFNINPVGSGPYKIKNILRNKGGIPTMIELSSSNKYTPKKPHIKSIIFKFFQNENELLKAYEEGSIESASGISQVMAKKLADNLSTPGDKTIIDTASLPRVFGVFFNQNVAPVLLNKEIREALDVAVPKKRIVDEVLYGFGRALSGPTPENIETDPEKIMGNIEKARAILERSGWKENKEGVLEKKTKTGTVTFNFSLSTSNSEELKKTALILKEVWEKLGAKVEVKIFEASDLSQNIIRGRKYDALLFGEVVSAESDLYPFWHSSERNDPGLNVALYANISVDKMLEEIQKETDSGARAVRKEALISEIKKDRPVIFLFSPYFVYLPSKKVRNISLKGVSTESERFLAIPDWFIETDKVWNFSQP